MKITKRQLRRIIRESLDEPGHRCPYSSNDLLNEGLFSSIGAWLKKKFGDIKVEKNPSDARAAVDEAIHGWIMSLIKDKMENNSDLSEEEAKDEAIEGVKSIFKDSAHSPIARWEKA